MKQIFIGNQTAFSAAALLDPFEHAVVNSFDAFEWFPDKNATGLGWDEEDMDAALRKDICKIARACDMRLSVHARWQADPLQPGGMDLLMKDLELARDLSAGLLNLHLCTGQGIPAFVRGLQPLIEQVAVSGLSLSIENSPEHTPEDFNALFTALRQQSGNGIAHVGMCFDMGHANLCAATLNDYLAYYDRLDASIPIVHLHVHENWGDQDSHLPLFTGPSAADDTGVRRLLKRLKARRFSGSMILEVWPDNPLLLDAARERLLAMWGE